MSEHVDAGARFEFLKHPLPGFRPPSFSKDYAGWGVPYFYVKTHFKNWDLTLGNFYEQFGSGFILRTYEERNLGIDNSLLGGRFTIRPVAGVSFKLLGGKQRRYSMIIRAPNGTIEDNKIYGGTGIHLSNEIGSWYEGPLPRNTKVRGNTFENTWGPCPLVVSVGIFPNIKFGLPYGISIIDNTFKLTMPENKYAISIYNGSDFTIKRNKYFNALDELIPESEAVHISDFVENVKMKSKTPEANNEKK